MTNINDLSISKQPEYELQFYASSDKYKETQTQTEREWEKWKGQNLFVFVEDRTQSEKMSQISKYKIGPGVEENNNGLRKPAKKKRWKAIKRRNTWRKM